MDCLTFISNLVSSLAWPIAIVVIVISMRAQIASLITNIKKLKAGSIEAEFEKLEQEVQEVREKAEAVSTKFDEVDDAEEVDDQSTDDVEITDIEGKVLKAIIESRYVMRSITGVANDAGLTKVVVKNTYYDLVSKGLLRRTKDKERRLRWYLTSSGHRVAANLR